MHRLRTAAFAALALFGSSSAGLVVSHQSNTSASPTNLIRPFLRLENQGSASVDLAGTTISYMTNETIAASQLATECWYVGGGSCSDLKFRIENIPTADRPTLTEGRTATIRVIISIGAGQLAAGSTYTIQWGMHSADWQYAFNENDDWSFTQADGIWNVAKSVEVGTTATTPTVSLEERVKQLEALVAKLSSVVEIDAQGNVALKSKGNLSVASAGNVSVQAAQVDVASTGDLKLQARNDVLTKAGRDTELRSTITTRIEGTKVDINASAECRTRSIFVTSEATEYNTVRGKYVKLNDYGDSELNVMANGNPFLLTFQTQITQLGSAVNQLRELHK